VSLQGGIDRGWFRAPRSTKDGKPHLPSILAIASDIVSAMAYLHAVSDIRNSRHLLPWHGCWDTAFPLRCWSS